VNRENIARQAYLRASKLDASGDPRGAITLYRRALSGSLNAEDRAGALLGLGSSLRNVDETAQSVKVLRRAVAEFPGDGALMVFLALSLYDCGKFKECVQLFLKVLVDEAASNEARRYSRALKWYRRRLKIIDRH
jgi:tetratricopeptide (TPR) repeat protein